MLCDFFYCVRNAIEISDKKKKLHNLIKRYNDGEDSKDFEEHVCQVRDEYIDFCQQNINMKTLYDSYNYLIKYKVLFSNNNKTGSFLLIDKEDDETIACGVITNFLEKQDNVRGNQEQFLVELSQLVKKYFGDNSNIDFSI